jgi:hypothetical protein
MRALRWAALVLAIAAGYLVTPRPATAAALPTAGLAATGTSAANPLVADVQYRRHRGWHRGGWHRRAYYGPRRHWRRGYYRPRPAYYGRRFYGPRVVCRVRHTAWGPRRVCFRR